MILVIAVNFLYVHEFMREAPNRSVMFHPARLIHRIVIVLPVHIHELIFHTVSYSVRVLPGLYLFIRETSLLSKECITAGISLKRARSNQWLQLRFIFYGCLNLISVLSPLCWLYIDVLHLNYIPFYFFLDMPPWETSGSENTLLLAYFFFHLY